MKKEFKRRSCIPALVLCSALLLSLSVTAASNDPMNINQLSKQVAHQADLLNQQSKELTKLKKQIAYVQHHNQNNASIKRTSLLGWESGPYSAKISGQVNMAGMMSDDGYSRDLYFVTNSITSNRIKLETTVQNTPDFSIGSVMDLGLNVNPGSSVSQVSKNGSNNTDFRKIEIIFNSKKLGKVSLGKGQTASDDTAQSDLSGTDVVTYSKIDDNGSGIFFRKKNEVPGSSFTRNPTVGDVFDNLDGQSRQTRVRYDTPLFNGFSFATSYMTNYIYDFALRYLNTFPWFQLQSALAYVSSHSTISSSTGTLKGNQFDGSVSVLFNCGFNVTYAGGKFNTSTFNRQSPYFHFIKIGYLAQLNRLGKTGFSVNYSLHRHFNVNSDRAKSYGAEIVQHLSRDNTEIYISYQEYDLYRIANSYYPVALALVGARYKFG